MKDDSLITERSIKWREFDAPPKRGYIFNNLHFLLGFMKTFIRAVGRRWLLQAPCGPDANATDLELHDVTLTASR